MNKTIQIENRIHTTGIPALGPFDYIQFQHSLLVWPEYNAVIKDCYEQHERRELDESTDREWATIIASSIEQFYRVFKLHSVALRQHHPSFLEKILPRGESKSYWDYVSLPLTAEYIDSAQHFGHDILLFIIVDQQLDSHTIDTICSYNSIEPDVIAPYSKAVFRSGIEEAVFEGIFFDEEYRCTFIDILTRLSSENHYTVEINKRNFISHWYRANLEQLTPVEQDAVITLSPYRLDTPPGSSQEHHDRKTAVWLDVQKTGLHFRNDVLPLASFLSEPDARKWIIRQIRNCSRYELDETEVVKAEDSKNKWIDYAYKAETALDESSIKKAVHLLYGLCGIPEPSLTIAQNPFDSMKLAFDPAMYPEKILKKYIRSGPESKADRRVLYNEWIHKQYYQNVWDFESEEIQHQEIIQTIVGMYYDDLALDISRQLVTPVMQSVLAKLKVKLPSFIPITLSLMDSSRMALYDYYYPLLNNKEHFDILRQLWQHGFFHIIHLPEHAIVCRKPIKIHRDSSGALCTGDEPAVVWSDGFSLSF